MPPKTKAKVSFEEQVTAAVLALEAIEKSDSNRGLRGARTILEKLKQTAVASNKLELYLEIVESKGKPKGEKDDVAGEVNGKDNDASSELSELSDNESDFMAKDQIKEKAGPPKKPVLEAAHRSGTGQEELAPNKSTEQEVLAPKGPALDTTPGSGMEEDVLGDQMVVDKLVLETSETGLEKRKHKDQTSPIDEEAQPQKKVKKAEEDLDSQMTLMADLDEESKAELKKALAAQLAANTSSIELIHGQMVAAGLKPADAGLQDMSLPNKGEKLKLGQSREVGKLVKDEEISNGPDQDSRVVKALVKGKGKGKARKNVKSQQGEEPDEDFAPGEQDSDGEGERKPKAKTKRAADKVRDKWDQLSDEQQDKAKQTALREAEAFMNNCGVLSPNSKTWLYNLQDFLPDLCIVNKALTLHIMESPKPYYNTSCHWHKWNARGENADSVKGGYDDYELNGSTSEPRTMNSKDHVKAVKLSQEAAQEAGKDPKDALQLLKPRKGYLSCSCDELMAVTAFVIFKTVTIEGLSPAGAMVRESMRGMVFDLRQREFLVNIFYRISFLQFEDLFTHDENGELKTVPHEVSRIQRRIDLLEVEKQKLLDSEPPVGVEIAKKEDTVKDGVAESVTVASPTRR
ncbi:hypothetical protein C8J56DRAFT_1045299 [Mycena floridula]|nr:hypothetical protein C8J56DRAFT_1045299 [Mycena floridula]